MTTYGQSPQRVLAVNVELPKSELARIAEASGPLRVVDKRALKDEPSLLDEAEVLCTLHTPVDRIASAKHLRWVQTFSAGVDWLLTRPIRARTDLSITNARGIHAQPIAEHVFGLILAFSRGIHVSELQKAERLWDPRPPRSALKNLTGATLGVLGLGAIGARVAELGAAFGMRVVGLRRRATPTAGVSRVYDEDELTEFLAASDYVINALPLTPTTRGLIGAKAFAAMRDDAILINIGRGATVDTSALLDALATGKIGGAGLDVTDPEPLPSDHPLWTLPNVIITPHYAGAHPDYEVHANDIFVDNLARYTSGRPLINLVDKDAGY